MGHYLTKRLTDDDVDNASLKVVSRNLSLTTCHVEASSNHVEVKVESGETDVVARDQITVLSCSCVGAMLATFVKVDFHTEVHPSNMAIDKRTSEACCEWGTESRSETGSCRDDDTCRYTGDSSMSDNNLRMGTHTGSMSHIHDHMGSSIDDNGDFAFDPHTCLGEDIEYLTVTLNMGVNQIPLSNDEGNTAREHWCARSEKKHSCLTLSMVTMCNFNSEQNVSRKQEDNKNDKTRR